MGVVAYLALIVAIPALLLGHQGQDWPLTPLWRTLRTRMPRAGRCVPAGAPQGLVRLPRDLQGAPESAGARTASPAPAWARTDEEAA